MASSLPTELITSILTRLPAKSLTRFKSVSKAWNFIIKSSELIKLYLTQSLSSDHRLLILNYGTHLESKPLILGSGFDDTVTSRFDLPASFYWSEISVCGSCNGLVALVCRNVDVDPKMFEFFLWNPSTNTHFAVPRLTTNADLCSEFLGVSFGFGYDCFNDDYKIIKIADYFYSPDGVGNGGDVVEDEGVVSDDSEDVDDDNDGSEYAGEGEGEDYGDDGIEDVDGDSDSDDGGEHSIGFIYREVMVYSLKKNSWKMIHVLHFGDEMKWFCQGAVINKHIVHWIFWKFQKREPRLRGFDLTSSKWTKLGLPDFRGNQNAEFISDDVDEVSKSGFESSDIVVLGVLDECLCIVTRICPEFDNAYVWVMKEYGIEESWTKLFNVTEASIVGPLLSAPLACSKGGDEVLLRKAGEKVGLCWYNLKGKTVKAEPKIPNGLKLRDVNLCVESLVRVTGLVGVDGSDQVASKSEC